MIAVYSLERGPPGTDNGDDGGDDEGEGGGGREWKCEETSEPRGCVVVNAEILDPTNPTHSYSECDREGWPREFCGHHRMAFSNTGGGGGVRIDNYGSVAVRAAVSVRMDIPDGGLDFFATASSSSSSPPTLPPVLSARAITAGSDAFATTVQTTISKWKGQAHLGCPALARLQRAA